METTTIGLYGVLVIYSLNSVKVLYIGGIAENTLLVGRDCGNEIST